MKLTFNAYGNIQTANDDGTLTTWEAEPGQTKEIPDDVAILFIETGVASPAKATKAKAPAGETADL